MKAQRRHTTSRASHRHFSPLWVCLAVSILLITLMAVNTILVKNKTHSLGHQQAQVENEIFELKEKRKSLELKFEEAIIRDNLTEELQKRRSLLKTISRENIVELPPEPLSADVP